MPELGRPLPNSRTANGNWFPVALHGSPVKKLLAKFGGGWSNLLGVLRNAWGIGSMHGMSSRGFGASSTGHSRDLAGQAAESGSPREK